MEERQAWNVNGRPTPVPSLPACLRLYYPHLPTQTFLPQVPYPDTVLLLPTQLLCGVSQQDGHGQTGEPFRQFMIHYYYCSDWFWAWTFWKDAARDERRGRKVLNADVETFHPTLPAVPQTCQTISVSSPTPLPTHRT